MEPFALFQILQNLLNSTPTLTENTSTPAPPPQTENQTAEQPAPVQEDPPAAILDFLEAHDKRAKRIKK